jgi:transposase
VHVRCHDRRSPPRRHLGGITPGLRLTQRSGGTWGHAPGRPPARDPCRPRAWWRACPGSPPLSGGSCREPCRPASGGREGTRASGQTQGAGRAVPQQTGVAAISGPGPTPRGDPATRTGGPRTAARRPWAAWRLAHGGTEVARERPGASWNPGVTRRERDVQGLVVQAAHRKAVPGRKPDGPAAAWSADRRPPGLVTARWVPPGGPRARRDVPRQRRTVVRARGPGAHRGQKVRERAPRPRARGATAGRGVSGRALGAARRAGQARPAARAARAHGRRREPRAPLATAVAGRVHVPQRGVWTARVCQLDPRAATLARVEAPIEAAGAPDDAAVVCRETRPGVARQTAARRGAASGTDRRRVPTAEPLAAWAGSAPGPPDSAGQRRSGPTRPGHPPLGGAWPQAAPAASRPQHPDGSAPDRRLAGRRGQTTAIGAVAQALGVLASPLLPRTEPDRAWGGDSGDQPRPDTTATRRVNRVAGFGDAVTRPQPPLTGAAYARLFARQFRRPRGAPRGRHMARRNSGACSLFSMEYQKGPRAECGFVALHICSDCGLKIALVYEPM